MLIGSPACGLRAVRAAGWVRSKVRKPGMVTFSSPLATTSPVTSARAARTASASLRVTSARSDRAATSSLRFMLYSRVHLANRREIEADAARALGQSPDPGLLLSPARPERILPPPVAGKPIRNPGESHEKRGGGRFPARHPMAAPGPPRAATRRARLRPQ